LLSSSPPQAEKNNISAQQAVINELFTITPLVNSSLML
jgi:hypothetical protein